MADLITEIDAEMEGRQRGYADVRGELLFRSRDLIEALTAQVAEAEWIINEHHLFALAQLKRDGKKPATRGAGLELHQRTKAWMEARLAAAKEPS